MKRILITGMSGTGKSSVIRELAARGYTAVDTDEGGFSEIVSVPADELTGIGPGQDWVWNEDRIQALLSRENGEILFLSGCSPNQGTFYPQLDAVILLTASPSVIVERLSTRTTNPFGKRPEEVARVLALQETIEPLLRQGTTAIIDTSREPLEAIVAHILRIAGVPQTAPRPA